MIIDDRREPEVSRKVRKVRKASERKYLAETRRRREKDSFYSDPPRALRLREIISSHPLWATRASCAVQLDAPLPWRALRPLREISFSLPMLIL